MSEREHKWQSLRDESVLERIEKKFNKPKPLNEAQEAYLYFLETYSIVFATGPAGTSKTFWAVGKAIEMLTDPNRPIDQIVLTRPLVTCGKDLGFLPGDLKDKFEIYTDCMTDNLENFIPKSKIQQLIKEEKIKLIPLAYMKGLSLKRTYVVADEMEDSEFHQLKLLLTRIGESSRFVIIGDTKQSDLHQYRELPLLDVINRLRKVEDIKHFQFGTKDIVRHGLIQQIIECLE